MKIIVNNINEVLKSFVPIGLEEMDNVRLMDRIDTKYLLPVNLIPELLIRMDGGYRVLEINKNRSFCYHTTYLDTIDYGFFNQHVTGRNERIKVRFRNYTATGTTFLEVKKKTKQNRTIKWRIENGLNSENDFDLNAKDFITTHLGDETIELRPVLINSFNRITLVGAQSEERLTIDYNISYSDLEGNNSFLPYLSIVELKKNTHTNNTPVGLIMKQFSVFPTGFSKYCVGAALLHNIPKKNILKEKMLLIKKIENGYS